MSMDSFYIEQPVRVTDLNYGDHEGIAHLSSIGLSEADIGGVGIMALESTIKLSAECLPGDRLGFFLNISVLSRTQFKCTVSVINIQSNKTVAMVEEKILCFDYERKRPAAIPESFGSLFQKEVS